MPQRDQLGTTSEGLVRAIGRWSLVALMANSILGAGIFGLPSLIAARLDGYSPLSCLIAGCGALIIAACIAEISSRFEKQAVYISTDGRRSEDLPGW